MVRQRAMKTLKWPGLFLAAVLGSLSLAFLLAVVVIYIRDSQPDNWDPGTAALEPRLAEKVSRAVNAANVCYKALGHGAGVHAEGNIICFFREIVHETSAAEFLANPIPQDGIVVVRSPGGTVDEAVTIAEALLAQRVTIVVAGKCISSCANYLFLAGAAKIVLANSWVIWHGGPTVLREDESDPTRLSTARQSQRLSDEFYQRVGVNRNLMYYCPDAGVDQLRIPPEVMDQPAWSYPADVLETRFGVKGIDYQWIKPGARFAVKEKGGEEDSCERVPDRYYRRGIIPSSN